MYMQTSADASPFLFDRAKSWTENYRLRAYAICAATDQDVLAYATSGIDGPLESTDADALINWERNEAAETIKYFETEHDEVVAEAERCAAAEPIDVVPPPPPAKASRKPAKPTSLDDVSLGKGFDWTETDGLLGDMTDWIKATSYRPNPPLATAAAVAILSTVCGRRLFTPTGLSLAVYINCLAKTGVGKQAPLDAIPQPIAQPCVNGISNMQTLHSVLSFLPEG
jgi:hypothetical protein